MEKNKATGILAVIVAQNECRCVKINVKILLEELAGTGSEIVVVDNGSKDGLQAWLEAQSGISYMISDRIEGYGKILGVVRREFGDDRDLLLLRANCFLTPGSIAAMKEVLDAQEQIAAAAPVGNLLAGEQTCSEAATYEAACQYRIKQAGGFAKTAYLDADVMLLKRNTVLYIQEKEEIPLAAMHEYRRAVLEQKGCFAVVKNAVCFCVCAANEEPYRMFDPLKYQKEQLFKLLYSFGDLTYQGVHLYKYLESEILSAVNAHKKLQNTARNRSAYMWQSDQPVLSSQQEAEAAARILETLPQKDILFVTLMLRRMYQGQFVHTVMESFTASMEEENYMELEYVSKMEAEGRFPIPTKNRYAFLIQAVPRLYGVQEADSRELMDFLWSRLIHPLELVLGIQFHPDLIRSCFKKAVYIVKERSAYLEFYRKVLEKVKPKAILYSHGEDRLLIYLRDAALQAGIPTLEIAHSVTVLGAYHKHLAYADEVLSFSGMVAEQSRLAGNTHVWGIGKPGVYEDQKIYPKDGLKIVVAFISSLEEELFSYAKNLAKKLDQDKYQVIYKMHSAELWTDQEILETERSIGNFKFAGGNLDIRDLAGMSDLVVGIRSTGIFDILPYPMVKVIAVKERAEYDTPYTQKVILQEVADRGEIVMVQDEAQLYEEVMQYRRGIAYRNVPNSFWPADAKERYKKLVNRYL